MKSLILCLLLTLAGCGYQVGDGGLASQYKTISIPYAVGDWDGDLTAALVERVARSGMYSYQSDGGAVLLQVTLINQWEENIGYRYYRNKEEELKKDLIPTETRLNTAVEVVLVEAASGKKLLGPVRLAASVDFDHDYYTMRKATNVFSLGQLNDYDSAVDAVQRPLNRALAQKIVDFINDSW